MRMGIHRRLVVLNAVSKEEQIAALNKAYSVQNEALAEDKFGNVGKKLLHSSNTKRSAFSRSH